MSYASKDDLFGGLDGEDLELPNGKKVRVRGLSRLEAASTNKGENVESEQRIIALGLVQPAMTLAEVRRLYKSAPAGIPEMIARKIQQLTMGTREPKEWSHGVPETGEPGELRVLPGGPDGPDDHGAARVDDAG